MPRRHRIRCVLKWTGTIACVLVAAVFVGSRWVYVDWRDCRLGDHYICGRVDGGVFYSEDWKLPLGWSDDGDDLHDSNWSIAHVGFAQSPKTIWWEWPLLDRNMGRDSRGAIYIPIWIPFVLIATPTASLWRLDRRRPRAGRCRRCDYDLTGNVSGRCPECGTAYEPASPIAR